MHANKKGEIETGGFFIMGRVIAVCISKEKGTQKYRIPEGEFIEEWGIKDDAHAGKWHRQVSLLSYDKVLILPNFRWERNFDATM